VPAPRSSPRTADVPTLGVEEELHLLDEERLVLRPVATGVLTAARRGWDPARGELQGELTLAQVETATPVCATLAEVASSLGALRARFSAAAVAAGCRLASAGVAPLTDWRAQLRSPEERYAALAERAGRLVAEQQIAGLHVHIGVPDPADAVRLLDGLRPWLPVLLALSASSPWWEGSDTGFASWRAVHWRRWPVVGPPPVFGSVEGYDTTAAALERAGVISGPMQLYWDARRSLRWPTVEVRVADAQPLVEGSVVLAGLIRGLGAALLAGADGLRGAGDSPAEPVPDVVLQAATWRAARWGLTEQLVDPTAGDGRLVPAGTAVEALLRAAAPGLAAAGDTERVQAGVRRLLREGGPAQRLRAAGSAYLASRLLVEETVRDLPPAVLVRSGAGDPDDPDTARLRAEVPPHSG